MSEYACLQVIYYIKTPTMLANPFDPNPNPCYLHVIYIENLKTLTLGRNGAITHVIYMFRAHSRGRGRFHVFCMGNPEKTQIVKKTRPLSRGHSVKWTPLQPNPHVPAGTGPLRPVALRRGRGTKWPPQIMTGGRVVPMGPLGRIIRLVGLGGCRCAPNARHQAES